VVIVFSMLQGASFDPRSGRSKTFIRLS